MFIRFIVKNLFSFKELTEFNMIPGRYNRLPEHVYKINDLNILKISSIYGANGAGKSNLIKAIAILKRFVLKGEMPIELITQTFKFDKHSNTKDVYLGIEFIANDIPYYYGITINQGIIIEEELLISGLNKKDDEILFRRTDKVEHKELELIFSKEVESDPEASIFPEFLKNELLERNKPVMFYMEKRQNPVFEHFKNAQNWFDKGIELILPHSWPSGLAISLEKNKDFLAFTNKIMSSFNTGIKKIHVETVPIKEFFGEDDKEEIDKITSQLRANPGKIRIHKKKDEQTLFVIENESSEPVTKRIYFTHLEDNGETKFQYAEESDGTRRLLEYLPAFYWVINSKQTFFIDEIERSIHPLLIKELINKFSHDKDTKGQLIFSTHESNLLDQDIFRPDEIWFTEKNKHGGTVLYPLSEYKEHHTIDIRKGYLNGRYGGIPFLGNLIDLKWDTHAETN